MSIQQLFFSGAGDQITATGGTINTVGDYRYHTFYSTSSITFTAYNSSSYTINMWLQAGGFGGENGQDNPVEDPQFDGRSGGPGGTSGMYRVTSTTAGVFGLNTSRTVTVGGAQEASQIIASTTFDSNGGGNKNGGAGGTGGNVSSTQGTAGSGGTTGDLIATAPFNTSPTITRSGGGGGGGGGGGYVTLGLGGSGGAGASNGGGSGGNGGIADGNGADGTEGDVNSGGGGGGGGGAGGTGNSASGGLGANGGSGFVIIAYKYRNN